MATRRGAPTASRGHTWLTVAAVAARLLLLALAAASLGSRTAQATTTVSWTVDTQRSAADSCTGLFSGGAPCWIHITVVRVRLLPVNGCQNAHTLRLHTARVCETVQINSRHTHKSPTVCVQHVVEPPAACWRNATLVLGDDPAAPNLRIGSAAWQTQAAERRAAFQQGWTVECHAEFSVRYVACVRSGYGVCVMVNSRYPPEHSPCAESLLGRETAMPALP